MASAWFDEGIKQFVKAATNFTTDTIRTILLLDTYTHDVTHQFVTNLTPGTNEVSGATREDLGTKAYIDVAGSAQTPGSTAVDAADVTFNSIADQSPNAISAVVTYKFDTDDTASPNLFFNDFTDIQGNGSNIQVQWDAAGIALVT